MVDESSSAQRLPVSIEDEMRTSYLDYAMSVIIGRALPDVRDGLKPVHRRVLYAMFEAGNRANRSYRKSAKTVGEVIGKFHPHGDQAVYSTIVRLAQDFSMRYPLIDGQGNFGSVDGDPAAAMRYTEIRMDPLAEELLRDIDKETVDFGPNYDNTEHEPLVLPCAFPNLLANGADGIAVGMATRIPPHNLRELIDACHYILANPDCTVADIMRIVKGPDFPTAGQIYGRAGIHSAYSTGRGRILVRGRIAHEEGEKNSRDRLVISELPFQVNKVLLIEEIAGLVRDKKLEGIADIRDESDRDGIRLVLELRKDAVPNVVINNLYKHTKLQVTFGAIFLSIVDGRPRVLDLKRMLGHFLTHRREVIVRRTLYLLREAEARAHILEGLRKALDHLDEVIALIRASNSREVAKTALIERFGFTEIQADHILKMQLQQLTALERQKLLDELTELLAKIEYYRQILASSALVDQIVGEELKAIREKYGDERRTEIVEDEGAIDTLDMIADEAMVLTLSHKDYVKRTQLSEYRSQGRGGKGIKLMEVQEDDFIQRVRIVSSHDTSLWFTSMGRVYPLPVWQIPQASRTARGKAIVNLLGLKPGEKVQGLLTLRTYDQPGRYIVTITRKGVVKKTEVSAYGNIRSGGIIALTMDEDDSLIAVHNVGENDHLFIATRSGMSIRFASSEVRSMGRTARGVRGMELRDGDEVVSASVLEGHEDILTLSTLGYGKRTPAEEYRSQGRGGLGIINMAVTAKTGPIIGSLPVTMEDEIIVATRQGMTIRTNVGDISQFGRNTQGVRIIRIDAEDEAVSVTRSRMVSEDAADAAEAEAAAAAATPLPTPDVTDLDEEDLGDRPDFGTETNPDDDTQA